MHMHACSLVVACMRHTHCVVNCDRLRIHIYTHAHTVVACMRYIQNLQCSLLQVAHTAGVTSTPDFFVRELNTKGGDCVLMLATDGTCAQHIPLIIIHTLIHIHACLYVC
jgi:hypothetical protein